jgi:hypothetical protein
MAKAPEPPRTTFLFSPRTKEVRNNNLNSGIVVVGVVGDKIPYAGSQVVVFDNFDDNFSLVLA